MYISSFWILSFAAFALATFPLEIQQKLFPHRNSLKLASHPLQSADCKPVARDSKWLATKPRKNSIGIARRQMNTSNDCQPMLPKRMTQEEDRKWTNAKRLAAGFPIKPPKTRKPTRAGFPRQEPSAAPTLTAGTANLVTDSGDSTSDLGSIAYRPSEDVGFYNYISSAGSDNDDTIPITLFIDTTAAKTGSTYITTTNGLNSAYPYLGAILFQSSVDISDSQDLPTIPGSYDIGPGSFNFVALGATTLTAPGAYAYSDSMVQQSLGSAFIVESSIYSIDATGNLVATWTNADGSTVQLYFAMIIETSADDGSLLNTEGPYGFGDKALAEELINLSYSEHDVNATITIKWVNLQFTPSAA